MNKRKFGNLELNSASNRNSRNFKNKIEINILPDKPLQVTSDDEIKGDISARSSLIESPQIVEKDSDKEIPYLKIPRPDISNSKLFHSRKSLDGTNSGLVYSINHKPLDTDKQNFIIDLSAVDMRIYRSIEYEALGRSKRTLFRDVWAMLKGSNVVDVFEVSTAAYTSFISETFKYYQKHKNTFHNFKHGVTVMNVCYFFLKEGNLSLYFDSLSVAALMFSSLMHDIGHTGRSNRFEENSRSQLAVVYNDSSILEMYHASLSFKILLHQDNNIFKSMDKEDYFIFRKYVIKGILSTDIKFHVSDLETFKAKIDNTNFKPYVTSADISDFLLLFGVLVHCADLYTPTKTYPFSIEWARLLNNEFTNQVKEEMALGLPVTPWYSKLEDTIEMAKSEKSFIIKVVRPLWTEVDRFFEGKLSRQINNLDSNFMHWDSIEQGRVSIDSIKVPPLDFLSEDEELLDESEDSNSRGGRTVVEEMSESGTITNS